MILKENKWKIDQKSSGIFVLKNKITGKVHDQVFATKKAASAHLKIMELDKTSTRLQENECAVNNMGDGNIAAVDPVLIKKPLKRIFRLKKKLKDE